MTMKSLLSAADAAGYAMAHSEDLLCGSSDELLPEDDQMPTIDQRHREAQPVRRSPELIKPDASHATDWLRGAFAPWFGGRMTA